jgi:hypothetical protein
MNSRREVIVHIGTPKTGTTALQLAFFKSINYFEERNVCYPDLTKSGFGWSVERGLGTGNANIHSAIPWGSNVAEERFAHIVHKAVGICGSSKTILMSSEILTSTLATPNFWKTITKLSEDLNLKFRFVVYLRDPFNWFIGCYQQFVKSSGFSENLDNFSSTFLHGHSELSFIMQKNFLEIMERAQESNSEFAIFRYEDSLPNIEKHFFENVLGFDFESIGIASSKVNPTFNIMELEFHRGVNSISRPLGTLFNFERSDTALAQHIKRYDYPDSKFVLSLESRKILADVFQQYRHTLAQITNFADRVDYSIDTSKLVLKLDETEEKFRNQIFELGRFVALSYTSGYINWDMNLKNEASSNQKDE